MSEEKLYIISLIKENDKLKEEIKKTLEEILIIVKKEQCLSDIERDIKYQQSMIYYVKV